LIYLAGQPVSQSAGQPVSGSVRACYDFEVGMVNARHGTENLPECVNDEEWAFVAPYLTLMTEDASQRDHSLPEVFNVQNTLKTFQAAAG
jgi:hypothetical protein